jgi:hypothetical protein
MAIRRSFIGAASLVLAFLLSTGAVHGQDLTGWIIPYGFNTPSLNAGQYAFQAGLQFDGHWNRTEYEGENWIRSVENSGDQYAIRSRLLYALTDQWAMVSDLTFTPGQSGSERSEVFADPGDTPQQSRLDLKATYNASLTITYKPTPVFEVFGVASYDRIRMSNDPEPAIEAFSSTAESYSLFIGFSTAR